MSKGWVKLPDYYKGMVLWVGPDNKYYVGLHDPFEFGGFDTRQDAETKIEEAFE